MFVIKDNQEKNKHTHAAGRIFLPVAVATAGMFAMSSIAYLLQAGKLPLLNISSFKIVNFTFTMQLYALPCSFTGLLFIFLYDRNRFNIFFRFRLSAGKNPDLSWNTIGPLIGLSFAVGLALLMSVNVMSNKGALNGTFIQLIPFVVLFAAANAWTEEILSRFVIVAGLSGKMQDTGICWISAVIFGVPHFLGTPSGLSGVLMAGFLGWLLSKSVIETRSLGWALVIHFLMDLVIFGAGAMIVAGSVN